MFNELNIVSMTKSTKSQTNVFRNRDDERKIEAENWKRKWEIIWCMWKHKEEKVTNTHKKRFWLVINQLFNDSRSYFSPVCGLGQPNRKKFSSTLNIIFWVFFSLCSLQWFLVVGWPPVWMNAIRTQFNCQCGTSLT